MSLHMALHKLHIHAVCGSRCIGISIWKRHSIIMMCSNWKINYGVHNSFHWPRHLYHIFSFIKSICTLFVHKEPGMNWCDVNMRKSLLLNWETAIWQFNEWVVCYATRLLNDTGINRKCSLNLKTNLCRFERFRISFFPPYTIHTSIININT